MPETAQPACLDDTITNMTQYPGFSGMGQIVAVATASVLIALSLSGCSFGQMACGSPEGRAKDLSQVLKDKHSPPLEHVKIEGWCDDETPYYGVIARLGPDLASARQVLAGMGCRTTRRQSENLDFDETATARMLCDVPTVGPVLVSLEPAGPLLSKQKYEGVRGFFAPLGED